MKTKAIFFDRDGVINNEENNYYIFRAEDFVFNPGIIESLMKLKQKEYIFIIISNQGGIAKGLYKHADVEDVHKAMNAELSRHDIEFAEIYYCPHHPFFERCICRKPCSLLIEKAVARFNIDVSRSWFVGDRLSDMEAGKKAGLNLLQVIPNADMSGLGDIIP